MKKITLFACLVFLFISCEKEELIEVGGNSVELDYQYIPNEKLEFFLNRLYIDLIGREPLDIEMASNLEEIKEDTISADVRLEIIQRLQYDTSFIQGDTSYLHAYSTNLYNLGKIKLLEGVADRDFKQIIGILKGQLVRDSITGDLESYEITKKKIEIHENVLTSNRDYRNGEITYNEIMGRMLNNSIYDIINMNTTNFVEASFNNLLLRYPTRHEFLTAFDMIENDISGVMFEKTGSNKLDYIDILIGSREMAQGIIIDTYRQALARDPSVEELASLLPEVSQSYDIKIIQQKIMVTDEYANF